MPGSIDAHMRETDAFSWTMEQDPLLRMTIVLLAVLDGPPAMPVLADRLERISRVAPMFRQRVIEPALHLAPPMFVVDPDFDLDWHLRRVEAAEPKTLASVLELAAKIGATAFDPMRALWECTVVQGLEDGRSAVIFKVHHTLTDGVGGMELLRHLFDARPDGLDLRPLPPLPPPRSPDSGSLRETLTFNGRQVLEVGRFVAGASLRTMAKAARHPVGTANGVIATARSVAEVLAPANNTLSPVMRRRGLRRQYLLLDVPTDRMKAAGHAAGGTLNDAFVAAVTGGLRIYHQGHGRPVNQLRGTLPISLRADGDAVAGNRIALIRYVVPIDVTNPAERIRLIGARVAHLRAAPALAHVEGLFGAVNRLPAAYLQGMAKHVDFVASNVPGLREQIYCAGVPVEAYYALSPTGGSSLNATLISYGDTCYVGVNLDTAAVPDGDVMIRCLREGFDEVLALADKPNPMPSVKSTVPRQRRAPTRRTRLASKAKP